MDDFCLSAAGRPVPGGLDSIRRYCGLAWSGGPPEVWAYQYYDRVPTALDNEVSRVDVLSASALHPGLSRDDLAFFVERADDLRSWLHEIPPYSSLDGSDEGELSHLAALRDFEPDVPLTLLTKVLHRKRPRFVPLLDRHIVDWYRPVTGERSPAKAWQPILRAMRGDLQDEPRLLLAIAGVTLRGEMSEPEPSWIRLLDIAIWMGARA